MGKALYRKYRPVRLDDVVAQDQVVTPLKEAIKKGKISHAYIFTGPRGCGKTSVARIFAHEINGFKYEIEDSYVDIIEIDAASNTGVDDIRDLREKAMIAPTEGKYKVYIIDEVHMLSRSAFNALLKIMEEPPEHVVFLMATTNPEKIPVTILSRAQTYVFKLASKEAMTAHLKNIAGKEGIRITDDALGIIVERGGGSFRDSISLLDQISNITEDQITAEKVEAALGLPEEQKIENLLRDYDSGDINAATDLLRGLLDDGIDAEALASDLIEKIVAAPTPATLDLVSQLFSVQAPFASAKLLVAFLKSGAPVAPPTILAAAKTAPTAAKSMPAVAKTPPAAPKAAPEAAPSAAAGPDPAPAAAPAAAPEPAQANIRPISWDNFLSEVCAENVGLKHILNSALGDVQDETIHIYPKSGFDRKVLTSEKQMTLMKSHSRGRGIVIHEMTDPRPLHHRTSSGGLSENYPQVENSLGETAKSADEISSISDIMGAVEEENTDADDPF